MKTKFFFMAAIVLCAVAANANTWRINYDENAHADFRTLKQACESPEVQDGDIFYMEPGFHNGSGEDNTISRPCTVIGPGWGFKNNAGEEIEVSTTHFATHIYIDHDSVHIMGLNLAGLNIMMSKPLYVLHKDVIIERCRCRIISCSSTYTYGDLDGGTGKFFQNLTIRNNLVLERIVLAQYVSYSSIVNNIIISNSGYPGISMGGRTGDYIGTRIDHNTVVKYNNGYCIGGSEETTPGAMITNNIAICTVTPYYSEHVCAFANGAVNNYNVYSITPEQYAAETTTKYSDHPTNQYVGATVENTFVNTVQGDFYDEAMRYMVQAGNVAKTAASDGGECGAFGGEHPYVLCGRPQGIPYLYDVDVPEHTTNNTLSISFKVAGQNE